MKGDDPEIISLKSFVDRSCDEDLCCVPGLRKRKNVGARKFMRMMFHNSDVGTG